ncbi:MAG: glycosyltransferase family 2 protein [Spirulina sp. SIO3F2]|nr:glycosyltransferase family 2 protein [Spirulina sp. SIO3F2]
MISLEIILSFKNEAENLQSLIQRISKSVESIPEISYRILAINDSSTDSSFFILQELSDNYPISVITTSRCYGVTSCLLLGLEYTKADYVVYLDSDLQDPPELIPTMLEKAISDSLDVVNTVRIQRKGENVIKMLLTSIAYQVIQFLSDISLKPNSGDFKLLSRRAVDSVLLYADNDPFMRGLTASVGFPQGYLEYVRESRFAGTKKFSLFRSLNPYRELIRAITLHSDLPLLISSMSCFLGIILSILYALIFLLGQILRIVVPGVTAPMVVISLMMIGIFLSLGTISIYMARILAETRVRKKPLTVFVCESDYKPSSS